MNVSKGTLKVSWKGQPAAEKYEVRYRTKYNASWKTRVASGNSITFNKLTKGQTLEYTVKPFLSLGGKDFKGSASSLQTVLNLDKNCSTTLSYAKRTLSVKWAPTKPAYGTMSYKVYYRVNGGKWSTKTTKSTSVVITRVKSSDRYEVKVVPLKTVGELTYTGAGGKSVFRYIRAGKIAKVSPGKTSATLTVNKLANTTGYEYAYSTDKTFKTSSKIKTKGASAVSTKIKGLGSNRTYFVKMRPYKSSQGVLYQGAWSPVVSFKTK